MGLSKREKWLDGVMKYWDIYLNEKELKRLIKEMPADDLKPKGRRKKKE